MFKVEIVLNCVLLIMFYDLPLPIVILLINFLFLVADKRLYKRLCPSVRPSVGRSVPCSLVFVFAIFGLITHAQML